MDARQSKVNEQATRFWKLKHRDCNYGLRLARQCRMFLVRRHIARLISYGSTMLRNCGVVDCMSPDFGLQFRDASKFDRLTW